MFFLGQGRPTELFGLKSRSLFCVLACTNSGLDVLIDPNAKALPNDSVYSFYLKECGGCPVLTCRNSSNRQCFFWRKSVTQLCQKSAICVKSVPKNLDPDQGLYDPSNFCFYFASGAKILFHKSVWKKNLGSYFFFKRITSATFSLPIVASARSGRIVLSLAK